ncbi:alpha/beta fold hydrolase [Nonomuraea salmonea]|uniref:alpha/beta fold hydrolase n=1 Tax=Nonomuraea salmonea TaxID=46181 RepID=UPI0031ED7EB7
MTIFVHEAGPHDADAVVLLHAVGTTGWMWERQVTALKSDLRVLVPDLPGHGRSAAVAWESIGGTAALVAELIAARAPSGRAHVVGLSLGGYVAATLAATAPRRGGERDRERGERAAVPQPGPVTPHGRPHGPCHEVGGRCCGPTPARSTSPTPTWTAT